MTPEDCARYERVAVEQLGEDCARWLATGERRDRSAEVYELLALDPPRDFERAGLKGPKTLLDALA